MGGYRCVAVQPSRLTPNGGRGCHEERTIEDEILRCPECGTLYDDPNITECPADGATLVRLGDKDDLIGKVVAGRFKVESLLGAGGMGAVYKAHQLSVDRPVALKLLKREITADSLAVKRFLVEAKATSRLQNNHTLTVYDFGQTEDGRFFMAMEFLEGRDLRAKLDAETRLPLAHAIKIMDGMAESLAEAHTLGIVHRDLKPENIFLARRAADPEFVKVLDFGIARAHAVTDGMTMTKTGTVAGTPGYMSPEGVVGRSVDVRADVYAMGIILYELLSGDQPFRGDTPFVVMTKHLNEHAPPLAVALEGEDIPEMLSKFVAQCMAKDPNERPADAGVFRQAMVLAAQNQPYDHVMQSLDFGQTLDGAAAITSSDPSLQAIAQNVSQNISRTHTPFGEATMAATSAIGGPQTFTSMEVQPKKSSMGLIAGVIVALVALGGGGFFLMQGGDDAKSAASSKAKVSKKAANVAVVSEQGEPSSDKNTVDPAAKPAEKTQAAPVAAPKPATPENVAVMIDSVPRGADVLRDGKSVGQTPVQLQLAYGDSPTAFKLNLKGHVSQTIEVIPLKATTRKLTLEPIPKPAVEAPKPAAKKKKKRKKASKPAATAKPAPKPKPKPKPKKKGYNDYLD